MICPYCGGEMNDGILKGDGRTSMKFIPTGEKLNFGDLITGKGRIDGSYSWGVFSIDANYCVPCKKMIIDTDVQR